MSESVIAYTIPQRIVKQLEYYFSDINLSRDKFLNDKIAEDVQSWVSIETLLTFERLKMLSATNESIVSAIKEHSSDLLEISDCETKLRRKPDKPLPKFDEEYRKSISERTLHLYGFPLDSTYDKLYTYCKSYGEIQGFKMGMKNAKKRIRINKKKRGKDAREKCREKVFKGCVFVTFADKQCAETMLNEDLKYSDQTLLKENQIQYYGRRQQFIATKREQKLKKREVIGTSDISNESLPSDHNQSDHNDSKDSITNGVERIKLGEELAVKEESVDNQKE